MLHCRRPTRSRWALWLFAAALVLKAAMPLLAAGSAGLHGKALVEVCTVYGMSMVSVDGDRSVTPASTGRTDIADASVLPRPVEGAAAHLDHQCPLTALAALAMADDPPLLVAFARIRSAVRQPMGVAATPGLDAPAAWVAGHKQGPPKLV